jgi:hypothetical protein
LDHSCHLCFEVIVDIHLPRQKVISLNRGLALDVRNEVL